MTAIQKYIVAVIAILAILGAGSGLARAAKA